AELMLVNPTTNSLTGDQVLYTAHGKRVTQVPYLVPPRGTTRSLVPRSQTGWIQFLPSANQSTPEVILLSLLEEGPTASLISIVGEPAMADTMLYIPDSRDATLRIAAINPHAI